MIGRSLTAFLTIFTFLSISNGAAAQEFQSEIIAIGGTTAGSLKIEDPVGPRGGYADCYLVSGEAGQQLTIDLTSESFDTYLEFGPSSAGCLGELSVRDDDGGEGADSRLVTVLPTTGTYIIRVTSYSSGRTGDYQLAVSAVLSVEPTSIELGQTVLGTLSGEDFVGPRGGYADCYVVSGEAGQQLTIDLTSESFDTYMEFGPSDAGCLGTLSTTDDDGGDGVNSRIVATLPESGAYIIRATSYSSGVTGGYSLVVTGSGAAEPASIAVGQSIAGTLSADDFIDPRGGFADCYLVSGEAGQQLTIDLTSPAFDTYLSFGPSDAGCQGALPTTDDDGGDGVNSRIVTVLPASGTYIIRATSYGNGATGEYELAVSEAGAASAAPSPAPEPGLPTLEIGETVFGTLSDEDLVEPGGNHADCYLISGEGGQQLTIDLVSPIFDTYLEFGPSSVGCSGDLSLSDDDGGYQYNSKIVTVLPATGEYIIRVTSFVGDDFGDYQLIISQTAVVSVTPSRIDIGQSVSGTLSRDDIVGPRGGFADCYLVAGEAGQQITIDLTSSAFDTYLEFGPGSAGCLGQLTTANDDGGESVNSRIVTVLPATGDYIIRATSFSDSVTGEYELAVSGEEAASAAPPPDPASGLSTLELGQTVAGTLSPNDLVGPRGGYADCYLFTGEAGQQITIDLTSSSIDTYLAFGPGGAGCLGDLPTTDDDGGSGFNSRLAVTLPATGDYIIRATSFGDGVTGNYQIAVSAADPAAALAEGTFDLSETSTPFVAGLAASLLERCGVPAGGDDLALVLGFISSGLNVALLGNDYDNPNLGEGMRSQFQGNVEYIAGAEMGASIPCGSEAEAVAAGIAAAIRDNLTDGMGGPSTFIRTCTSSFGESQCTCLASLGASVIPNINQLEYDRNIIYRIIQGNPLVGLQLGFQCGIVNY